MTWVVKRSTGASVAVRAIMVAAFAVAISAAATAPLRAAEPTVDELQKRLDARDATIRDLLRRVETLEREVRSGAAPAASAEARRQGRPPVTPAAAVPPVAAPRPAQQAQQQQQPGVETGGGGPGQFQVSEESAQRALERALVQTGALLLPPGVAEFVPGIGYTRRETENPGQIALLTNGQLFATQELTRQNQVEASALFRLGLPWTSQLEVSFPFDYKSVTTDNQVGGAALSAQTSDAVGIADPAITWIKQLAHEGEYRPSLFGSVGWDTNYGQRHRGIALGTGFNEVKGSLLAVKRQDPLVFTAGLGYIHSFEYAGLQPGDQYATSLGMFFAVSPETSLRISPQLTFGDETRVNGARVAGSNQVAGVMTFGILSILAPGLNMDLSTDIGVTRDAPKYAIRASFPIRFGLF